ncbi:MAG: isoleucine--tRNA ligase [Verrucomicrobia bacterium]|nr:isoleucine--tRNA ligase [Verrucomicrobiota bacterium]MDA1088359.1 isoleucine--tRNA ligase [Verrucomicrobiota bacterium]
MFEPVSNKVNFAELENSILEQWEAKDVFRRSVEQRRSEDAYVFYDGPPFATGLPHYGHLLASTIKDIVPRYQTMRGQRVERRFGWDCHGLPIEALAQEALSLSGSAAIREIGVDRFNDQCRSMVQTYVEEWRKTITRLGRWVDFENDYKTMDPGYMESVWWVFKQLWDQGRIYKAHRIMPYSWKLTTPLSNFEAGNNYKDVQDPSVTVRVHVPQPDRELAGAGSCYLLLWTTTPWTLPGNLAVCAGPQIEYVAVRDTETQDTYVMAGARLESIYKDASDYSVIQRFSGSELAGWTYQPLFDRYADQPNAFQVLLDDFVSTEEGTGLVHMAPAYGEDDYRICRAAAIDIVDPLDENCAFSAEMPQLEGQFCKDADKAIIDLLKNDGKLVHRSTIMHSYPFCERTDTPLIYRAIEAWYVRVEDMRDELTAANADVHWVPAFVGEKRFGNWLKEAKDWNISRNRFWGSCLPVWISEDGEDSICVGSLDELEELSGQRVTDLHKHVVDRVTFVKDGRTYRRTPEVLDCWFESGAMPFAQQHYPFERDGELDSFFPAHFIAEGLDQTRGWFYTLLVLSTALFKRSPYRNVIVNGLILAEDGRKMSKRLQNYPDPNSIMAEYGADALRMYLINSPVVRAEDLCFSEDGVRHAMRDLLIPLWNAYSFFVTYARIDGWQPAEDSSAGAGAVLLDRWILSSLEHLTADVEEAMDHYDLQRAVRPFVRFVEDLTNWYIRRSRRRFWKSTDDSDKAQAYCTLYEVLLRLSRIAAPFVPFISEAIYQNLRTDSMPDSVHLCDFPATDPARRDNELEEQMAGVMSVVGMGRLLRAEHNLKVRQPLPALHVVCRDSAQLDRIRVVKELVMDELNVKDMVFDQNESALVSFSAKANFRTLGPKLGGNVKQAAAKLEELDSAALEALLGGESLSIEIEGNAIQLTAEDVVIERHAHAELVVTSEGNMVVALDTTISDGLRAEGLAREFVNKVQNMRKTAEFEVSDRIDVEFNGPAEVLDAIESYTDYVMEETLALALVPASELKAATEWDLNGHSCRIAIARAG